MVTLLTFAEKKMAIKKWKKILTSFYTKKYFIKINLCSLILEK